VGSVSKLCEVFRDLIIISFTITIQALQDILDIYLVNRMSVSIVILQVLFRGSDVILFQMNVSIFSTFL